MKSKKIFSAVSGLIVLSLLSSGCGKKKEAAEDEEAEMGQVLANGNAKNPTTTGSVPQVGSINLGGLGDESSAAALNMTEESDETKCSDGPDMGIFGLALGGACHTTGLASKLMLGSESGDNNKDGKVDCGDYTEGKDNGIMLGLMCGDFFKRYDGIKAFSFENKEKADFLALSFADFNAADSLAAAGSWTKGDDTSYPANIRLWGSKTSFSALKGVFSANLSSLHAGEVQVDFENPLKAERMRVSSTFANNFDKKSGCAANPNASNCVFQEVKIYNPDDLNENGAPNGMHIRVLTDDKNAQRSNLINAVAPRPTSDYHLPCHFPIVVYSLHIPSICRLQTPPSTRLPINATSPSRLFFIRFLRVNGKPGTPNAGPTRVARSCQTTSLKRLKPFFAAVFSPTGLSSFRVRGAAKSYR